MVTWLIVVAAVIFVVSGFIYWMTRQYRKAGPNEVLVISGRKSTITTSDGSKQEIGYKFRIGGGSFVNPFTEQAETMPIDVVSLNIDAPEVLSKDGIPSFLQYFEYRVFRRRGFD